MKKMDRTRTRIGRMGDHPFDDFVPGSMVSRISMVWPLTREVTLLSREHDVERRLQRHVAVFSRRKR